MKKTEPNELAAWNNAGWCDAVCRAHGRPGIFRKAAWVMRQAAPPFFSNAVSLDGAEASAAHAAAVQGLVAGGLPGAWAVKDSFCTLDIRRLGFSLLFEAEWLYRPASRPRPNVCMAGVHWVRVTQAEELAVWEAAWRGSQEPFAGRPRLFPDRLLTNEDIAVIAAIRKSKVVAGAIGNRTGAVVGFSNIFLPREEAQDFRAGCLAQVIEAFPRLSVVGYDRGEALVEARAAGFDSVGHLRVWSRLNVVR
jgi:hypothetical protein